jgi:hypothetical protein
VTKIEQKLQSEYKKSWKETGEGYGVNLLVCLSLGQFRVQTLEAFAKLL